MIKDLNIFGAIAILVICFLLFVYFLYLRNWYKIQKKIHEFDKLLLTIINVDDLKILINEIIFFDRENICTKYHRKQFKEIIKAIRAKIEKLNEINNKYK